MERDIEGDMLVQRLNDPGTYGAAGTVVGDAAHITTMLVTATCGPWHGKTATVARDTAASWEELGWSFTMHGFEICRIALHAESYHLCAVAVSSREMAAVPRGPKGRATLVRPLVNQVRPPIYTSSPYLVPI